MYMRFAQATFKSSSKFKKNSVAHGINNGAIVQ
jgi:hypothetical protein